jgi:hypothetical protein
MKTIIKEVPFISNLREFIDQYPLSTEIIVDNKTYVIRLANWDGKHCKNSITLVAKEDLPLT